MLHLCVFLVLILVVSIVQHYPLQNKDELLAEYLNRALILVFLITTMKYRDINS
jgi:hypothetical protein